MDKYMEAVMRLVEKTQTADTASEAVLWSQATSNLLAMTRTGFDMLCRINEPKLAAPRDGVPPSEE